MLILYIASLLSSFPYTCIEISLCNIKDETSRVNLEIKKDPESSKGSQKDLPEYLKQRLKARGILKDDNVSCGVPTENAISFVFVWFIPYLYYI